MNSVFIKSSFRQAVPPDYASGIVLGPIKNKAYCGFSHTLDKLLCQPNRPRPTIKSFAALALATYMADKCYSRSESSDSWTRELSLNIPVNDRFAPTIPIFADGLKFLSGDNWDIVCRSEKVEIGERTYYRDKFKADAVCLFSGGTDSLTGTINLLEEGNSVVLVSHFESGSDAGIQNKIYYRLRKEYGYERVRHRSIRVCHPLTKESSTRSRSFLFIGLALMVASAFGEEVPIYIPENGFVGINIPLTGSRLGSYSTRTTHPAYFKFIQEGLRAASIGNSLINPFFMLTKGEVLATRRNQKLLKEILPLTVSCAKAGWIRWEGIKPGSNCGFCYPCLMRRAAFHSIDEDDPNSYVHDAIGSPKCLRSGSKGSNLRCLLQFVSRYQKVGSSLFLNILKSGTIASVERKADLIHPIENGLKEIIALISDKGCPEVKEYITQ